MLTLRPLGPVWMAIYCLSLLPNSAKSDSSYDLEIVPTGEAEQIADITVKTMQLQRTRAEVLENQQGARLRGVHPKSHSCVVGEFRINKRIPDGLRVGLFSQPGKRYKTLIRYSNAAVTLAPDLSGGNGSRGMAIKVFDVGGDVLVGDKGNNNQDFLMINTSTFAFPNVRSYQRLTDALVNSPSGADPRAAFNPEGLAQKDLVDLGKTMKVIGQIRAKTVRNPLEVRYFAAAPSTLGNDRVMKFSAEPCDGEKEQAPFEDTNAVSSNYLREAMIARMSEKKNVCLNFQVQVLTTDQVRNHRSANAYDLIEDASQEWDESEFPFLNVAKITIRSPQQLDAPSATQRKCESYAFNPWHSLTEHRPVGGINRLRQPVYVGSTGNRTETPRGRKPSRGEL